MQFTTAFSHSESVGWRYVILASALYTFWSKTTIQIILYGIVVELIVIFFFNSISISHPLSWHVINHFQNVICYWWNKGNAYCASSFFFSLILFSCHNAIPAKVSEKHYIVTVSCHKNWNLMLIILMNRINIQSFFITHWETVRTVSLVFSLRARHFTASLESIK